MKYSSEYLHMKSTKPCFINVISHRSIIQSKVSWLNFDNPHLVSAIFLFTVLPLIILVGIIKRKTTLECKYMTIMCKFSYTIESWLKRSRRSTLHLCTIKGFGIKIFRMIILILLYLIIFCSNRFLPHNWKRTKVCGICKKCNQIQLLDVMSV